MGKNDYLARQRAIQQAFFLAGLNSGRQQIIDMMSLVLRDQDIMGKDTFGPERLCKVVKGIKEYIDKFQPAWEKNDDTDYFRVKLDEALAEAYGEGMKNTFLERYDSAPEFDYTKGKWK